MIDDPKLAIVIVNYRTPELVERCLKSLQAERMLCGPFEVVVVDGGSGDGSDRKIAATIERLNLAEWVTLLPLDFNGGFGWANNQAALRLLQRDNPPEYIHFLNPDTEVQSGAIKALVTTLNQHANVGAVGSQLIEDGHPVASAFRFPSIGREFLHGGYMVGLGRFLGIKPIMIDPCPVGPVDWVTGASVMVRSETLRQSGLFDDGFFLYYEEVELMLRINRAGWQIWHQPESLVHHVGGAATGVESGAIATPNALPLYWFESRMRFFTRSYGSTTTVVTNLAWLTSHVIWRLRCMLFSRLRFRQIPGQCSQILSVGIIPSKRDRVNGIADWRSRVGERPLWSKST